MGLCLGVLRPALPDRGAALFLDFDGTLVDLAPQPDAVSVHPALPDLLTRLRAALDGALSIVSGRPVDEIDHQLAPLVLCVAGVHGVERRGADGSVRRIELTNLDDAAARVDALCRRHPALRAEHKRGALALHYRQAPELEAECLEVMTQALARCSGMALLHGKMVLEMKPAHANKGAAVREFLDEAPFRSRRPWYFGDDVTDESAFEVVQSLGGVAVKVGEGGSSAAHRLDDPAAVRSWLAQATAALERGSAAQEPRLAAGDRQ
jgi:trehalose 6-phosphate phosphatase